MVSNEYYDIIDFAELLQWNNKNLVFQLEAENDSAKWFKAEHNDTFGLIIGVPYTDAQLFNLSEYKLIDQYDLARKLDKYFSRISKIVGTNYDRRRIRLRGLE